MIQLFSSDFGAFALGRTFLRENLKRDVSFFVGGAFPSINGSFFVEKDFWSVGVESLFSVISRFGVVGFFYDRKNYEAVSFLEELDVKKIKFSPKNIRAKKIPELHFFATQVLKEMANEGLSDTVEFRRIARKFLREAKNAHCDTVFFLDAIFGEEETKKILQHLAGTQMRVVTPCDFFLSVIGDPSVFSESVGVRVVTRDTLVFTKDRAEKILKKKLALDAVTSL